jgi:hypothetical protein
MDNVDFHAPGAFSSLGQQLIDVRAHVPKKLILTEITRTYCDQPGSI